MRFISRTFFVFALIFYGIIAIASFAEAETVSVSPSSVASGGSITVNWTAPSTHSTQDWVSIFAVGADNTSYNSWAYVPGGSSGTVTLSVVSSSGYALSSGNYEIRYFLANSFAEPSPPARAPFTVTGGSTGGTTTGGGTTSTGFCGDSVCNNGETSSSCSSDCGTTTTTTTTVVAPPALFFGASPSVISAGQSTTLSWSGSNVSSCSASGDAAWSGSKPTAGSATFANMPEGTKTYTITCQTASGSAISSDAQVFVGPAPTPVVFFSATPSVLAAGGNVTLSWSSTNAVSCTGSGDAAWGTQNPKPTSGTITFTDVEWSTTYSIVCTNSTGQSSPVQSVSVVVGPTLSFTTSPATLDYGAKTLLAWTASPNVTSCTPTGFTSAITLPTGSVLVLPSESATYGLTCRTADSSVLPVTKTASVGVKPVFIKFDVNPETVNTGGSSTFTWQASPNAVSCDAAGDWSASNLPISGSKVFSNLVATQRFTLSCVTSDNLLVVQRAEITVIIVPVISSFTADKTTINSNEPITVTWSVINAQKCVIGGVPGGSLPVEFSDGTHTQTISNLTQNSTLTLLCGRDVGGSASKQVVITVNNIPPPLIFTADRTTINAGESVTVTWTVRDATNCVADGSAGWIGQVNNTDGTHTQTIQNIPDTTTLSLRCYGASENITKTIPITVNGGTSSLPLCSGVGKCKLSSEVCNGTRQPTADCTGGTLCCVPSNTPSSGQWSTVPTQSGTGLVLALIGSTLLGSLQAIPSGTGWQITSGGSGSLAPVLNSDGTLQIIPNTDGTWQVLPASGSTASLSNVQFTPNGSGGWNVTPVLGTTSGGSTGLGGGTGCNILTDPNGCFQSLGGVPVIPGTGVGPAETGGLVPCGTELVTPGQGADYKSVAEGCKFEQFIILAKNIMNFLLFTIAVPIAAISFAWAGWLYLSASGNESKVQEAHRIFGYVVWGLCIALAAWLIVNAIVIGLGVGSKYNFLGTG